jgi:hypothetical protein
VYFLRVFAAAAKGQLGNKLSARNLHEDELRCWEKIHSIVVPLPAKYPQFS